MTMQEFADQHNVYVAKNYYGRYRWYTHRPVANDRGDWYIVGTNGESGAVPPSVERDESIPWEESLISPKLSIKDLVVDQPVMVRNAEGCGPSKWTRRYFAGISPKGQIGTWHDGSTSWSSNNRPECTITWEEWRIPTEEELKGTSWENKNE